jgi:hypothetical protein
MYAAWLGEYVGNSCETWSALLWGGEIWQGSAKGFKTWGAAYNGGHCTGTERLVMRPSIWLERTDAHVGLQIGHIGQLAWWST